LLLLELGEETDHKENKKNDEQQLGVIGSKAGREMKPRKAATMATTRKTNA